MQIQGETFCAWVGGSGGWGVVGLRLGFGPQLVYISISLCDKIKRTCYEKHFVSGPPTRHCLWTLLRAYMRPPALRCWTFLNFVIPCLIKSACWLFVFFDLQMLWMKTLKDGDVTTLTDEFPILKQAYYVSII